MPPRAVISSRAVTPAAVSKTDPQRHLRRDLSLLGLVATAVAAMVGVGVNILPFMVQRSQPGIGAWVPLAYVVAAVPVS